MKVFEGNLTGKNAKIGISSYDNRFGYTPARAASGVTFLEKILMPYSINPIYNSLQTSYNQEHTP